MEQRLEKFISLNSDALSSSTSSYQLSQSAASEEEMVWESDPALMRLLGDGAGRFLCHQILELAADCRQKSKEDLITSYYFCEMSQNLDDLLIEVAQYSGINSKLPNSEREFGFRQKRRVRPIWVTCRIW